MKFPIVLYTEFVDGKTTYEICTTAEQYQSSLQNAQSLSGSCRVTVFECHHTLVKQTVWAEPPVTH